MNKSIIIFGSYGYTGKLIVEECRMKNLSVVLSGRNEVKLAEQSKLTGYPYQHGDLNDMEALLKLLQKGSIVLHCAGPFQYTAKQMAEACLKASTHYLDITGEHQVFEMLANFDERAKQAGITIMPGTGFDVVPSDCLALHLKEQLPSATHLQLAFASSGGFSRGTLKTMIEGLGLGSTIRRDGKLVQIKTAEKILEVDFDSFKSNAVCIPWGDISTAYRSTGIPNIEVYAAVRDRTLRFLKLSNSLNWLLGIRGIKNFLKAYVDGRTGPSIEKLKTGRSHLWGNVWDDDGNTREARLEVLNGYALTAKSSVLIAEKILNGNLKPGYQTPAMMYGSKLILEIEGSIYKS